MSNELQITKKIQEIELILTPDIDVLCVNEHWLNENNFMIYNLTGYKLASINYRLEKSWWCIYLHEKFRSQSLIYDTHVLKCNLKPVLSR